MFMDPKSGDYLAWFFCTREQTRGQMAHFSRQGCRLEHHLLSSQEDAAVPPEDFESVSQYPPVDIIAHEDNKKDIVDLIKRARARTDRTLALMRRNMGQDGKATEAARNPLETFVGGFAHHFNNLFMMIQCNVSLIISTRGGEHRHQRRLKRIEKLVLSESMLTNDLLGIVIEKGCHIDEKLQAHLLDEIVAIADTLIMRQAFCSWDDTQSADTELPRTALKRLSSGLAGILHQLLNEIYEHTAFIIEDNSADVVENARLRKIMEAVAHGRKLLRELAGNTTGGKASGARIDLKTMTEILLGTCFQGRDNIRCHLDIKSDMNDVHVDRSQVAAILRELYDNAVAAMPQGGVIFLTIENHQSVSKTKHDPYVRLTFRDTGVGMPPDVITRIFDPFFTGTSLREGKGLGLTAVDGLLQSVGGNISVESIPGKGTVFTVDFPAALPVHEHLKSASDGAFASVGFVERKNYFQILP